MARDEVKDGKGKLLGLLEDRGKEILAFDAAGRPKARFDKQKNITFDAGGKEIGKGNQLMRLLSNTGEQSEQAKSSFTARSAAQKATVNPRGPAGRPGSSGVRPGGGKLPGR
ncbi:MAG: hypothetical protein IT384_30815 [Deltaproteobacteria bacterium]|nr:hypothetical protein [Deltaproteobacteria bacterium]